MQEEVAAAKAPSQGGFILFLASILVPVLLGVWLLFRAEHSLIGQDESIRWLVRSGMREPVIRAYLNERSRKELPADRIVLPRPDPMYLPGRFPRQRRRRRRRRKRPPRYRPPG